MMRMLVLSLIPALVLALSPTLVSERPVDTDASQFRSPGGDYSAKVVYAAGNTEFVPFERFELLDRDGKTVYARDGGQHTVLDISDNGLVVGADFDGPVSGRAKLHFYDAQGSERGTADVGFWDRRGSRPTAASTVCLMAGRDCGFSLPKGRNSTMPGRATGSRSRPTAGRSPWQPTRQFCS